MLPVPDMEPRPKRANRVVGGAGSEDAASAVGTAELLDADTVLAAFFFAREAAGTQRRRAADRIDLARLARRIMLKTKMLKIGFQFT